jgi:DNA helicase-4
MQISRWEPTSHGRRFTSTEDWFLDIDDSKYRLWISGKQHAGSILELEGARFTPGIYWTAIQLPDPFATDRFMPVVTVDGIANEDAVKLKEVIASTIANARMHELTSSFEKHSGPALEWLSRLDEMICRTLRERGWITTEFIHALNESKPKGLEKLYALPGIMKLIDGQPNEVKVGMTRLRQGLASIAQEANERHQVEQLRSYKDFFDRVEKSPLSQEQARAVVCFESRVLLVASAGSGKTSTMVAKAGYALKNGYCDPDRLLLLAFNNDAGAELRERLKNRLAPLGLPGEHVAAKTFHAFGLEVIGLATGKRPTVAPWVESGRDLEYLLGLIDDMKDQDVAFKAKWDLFRVVLGQDLPKFGKEESSPDSWDRETRTRGFWTLNGEVVKSRGEQVIANWLCYNGVAYAYEPPYEVDTAEARHRQYHPDFYLPDAQAYLEHWAVDASGEPPPEFTGYKEGMDWKRKIHAECGTTLLETTMADLWSGKAFKNLEKELKKRGVALDPNPERPIAGRRPIENPRLARTIRSFMTHAKSNRLTLKDWNKRLKQGVAGDFRFRHQFFLSLMEPIWSEWEARLKAAKAIDFEDMVNLATDCIESGMWQSPYDLVMVDEFQDASNGRARMVAALLKGPNKNLFAVGDDWQSINRFAGADLSVMTDFESIFGKAAILKLERTFRCPQSLCDITSDFIQRNPRQLRKTVQSVREDLQDPVRIVRLDNEKQMASAVARRLSEIAQESQGLRPKVYLLGRYQKDRVFLPRSHDHLELDFMTVHGAKGLEADHIIIPCMTSDTLGFPCRVADDPVLLLAMPSGDDFADAEERRLFYVALTRARSTVTLLTVANKESDFVKELIKAQAVPVVTADGVESSSELCPKCDNGFMMERNGIYGPFWGCSSFPSCDYTVNIPRERPPVGSDRRRVEQRRR